MSIHALDFTKENTIDDSLDLNHHRGGLVLKEEQKLAVEALLSRKDVMALLPTGFGKSIIYQSFVVAKNLTAAFQLFCAMFLITLRVITSSLCFTLVPDEKLRFSTTSKDFGC